MNTLRTPIFESLPPDNPRSDAPTVFRETIMAIIEHPDGEQYIILDWKKYGWKTFLIGWQENDETPVDAVLREIIEETWFEGIIQARMIWPEVESNYFAAHKSENRKSLERYFVVKLNSLRKRPVKEEETKNHTHNWIHKKDVSQTLTIDNNLYIWHLFIHGILEDADFIQQLKSFRGWKNT